jgi:dihydroorotate dehydrogenase electron transfer subunit
MNSTTNSRSPRGQFTATVVANQPLCREHFRLILSLAQFPPTAPGHFIQIACDDIQANDASQPDIDWQPGTNIHLQNRELLESRAVLRRPFSLAARRDISGHVELDIIHRVVGLGTHWLENLQVAQSVEILGPLGNTFQLPPPDTTALLIGGGVGIPPMLYLAAALTQHKAIAFAGALTRDLLPLKIISNAANDAQPLPSIAEFAKHNIPSVISTDDGSYGFRGYITQALETFLDREKFQKPPILYTCGPEPMMKRVADIAQRRGLPCQVAVERAMACGMGTCQSCCIRVKKKDPAKPPLPGQDWCYRLACTDGPIFQAADLLW